MREEDFFQPADAGEGLEKPSSFGLGAPVEAPGSEPTLHEKDSVDEFRI
jgi:hypothetical protein